MCQIVRSLVFLRLKGASTPDSADCTARGLAVNYFQFCPFLVLHFFQLRVQ